MADSVRAIGWAVQSAVGTAVPPTVGANFVETFAADLRTKFRTPAYKRNQRIQETTVIPTTADPLITISQADVDATECLAIFASALGPASGGVYKFGQALNSTPASFLTVKWSEGLGQSWQIYDARVDTWKLTLDAANGTLRWNGTIPGLLSPSQPATEAWPPDPYSLPVGDVPYAPWQTTLKRGSTFFRIISFELDLNNHFDPLFATPDAIPGPSTPVGLTAARRKDGACQGGFKLTYEYVGESGSSYAAYRTNTREAWQIIMTDPTPSTGKTITLDIPVVGWTAGQLDYSQAETRQVLTGSALFDDTSGTSLTLTVA